MLSVWYRTQNDTDRTPRAKAKCTTDSTKCHTKTKNYTVRFFNGSVRVKSWFTWHTCIELYSKQFYQNEMILKLVPAVSG